MPKGQRSASASKATEDVLSGTAASSSDDAAVALEMSLLADEPRRSERVKRDKPDYYDALEYEKKRAAAAAASRTEQRAKRGSGSGAVAREATRPRLGRPPKSVADEDGKRKSNRHRQSTRATMSWKKDSENDSDDGHKRKRKKKRAKAAAVATAIAAQQAPPPPQEGDETDGEEDPRDLVDFLPPLRALHCKIFLSEINRRLGAVMYQPG